MEFLTSGINKVIEKYEKVETDSQRNGKLVEGYNIETYNIKKEKTVTFVPKDSILYKIKNDGELSFPDAMNLLLNLGYCVYRKDWEIEQHVSIVNGMGITFVVMSRPYYEGENRLFRTSPFIPLNVDILGNDWAVYKGVKENE